MHLHVANGLAHHEFLHSGVVTAPDWYVGGQGFESHQGLRCFLCPTLVTLRILIFTFISVLSVYKNRVSEIWTFIILGQQRLVEQW